MTDFPANASILRPRSLSAALNFVYNIQMQGGQIPLGQTWKGSNKPHTVICSQGHKCMPQPNHVNEGIGICRICARNDPFTAEINFRIALEKMGAIPDYQQWKGVHKQHKVICSNGHKCMTIPTNISRGNGPCSICGYMKKPERAEVDFLTALETMAATPNYDRWKGTDEPHNVICSQGHKCTPRPSAVKQGIGICGKCWVIHDTFYIVSTINDHVKFGITSGEPNGRLRTHASYGYRIRLMVKTNLPEGLAKETEDRIKRGLIEIYGLYPERGNEWYKPEAKDIIVLMAETYLSENAIKKYQERND